MKRLVFDLDNTLTIHDSARAYPEQQPNLPVIEKLREYKEMGFEIIIFTARNMRSFSTSIGKINAVTLPIIIDWLNAHDVPFDEVHVGKPWCGKEGFYIDDKAIRPSEFTALSYDEIRELLDKE